MKVLVFGPSGSGKSYVSARLKELGYNAFDADLIDDLSAWYDGKGNKVTYPENADREFLENHSFYWDKVFLTKYLKGKKDIYIFGSSGNIFEMLDLFDRVYFLRIDPNVQRVRLADPSRENPMGNTEYQRENAVKWGLKLEEKARKKHIVFIDGLLAAEKIGQIISS